MPRFKILIHARTETPLTSEQVAKWSEIDGASCTFELSTTVEATTSAEAEEEARTAFWEHIRSIGVPASMATELRIGSLNPEP